MVSARHNCAYLNKYDLSLVWAKRFMNYTSKPCKEKKMSKENFIKVHKVKKQFSFQLLQLLWEISIFALMCLMWQEERGEHIVEFPKLKDFLPCDLGHPGK